MILHCHDLCKISLGLVDQIWNQSTPNVDQISNSIKIPLVGGPPGATIEKLMGNFIWDQGMDR